MPFHTTPPSPSPLHSFLPSLPLPSPLFSLSVSALFSSPPAVFPSSLSFQPSVFFSSSLRAGVALNWTSTQTEPLPTLVLGGGGGGGEGV